MRPRRPAAGADPVPAVRSQGVKSALLSAKKKTISLPGRVRSLVCRRSPWVRNGAGASGPRLISTAAGEIDYWLAARGGLTSEDAPGYRLPVRPHHGLPDAHMAAGLLPNQRDLLRLDQFLAEAAATAPHAAFLLTADHGMNHKSLCWDLEKVCAARGIQLRIAISAERDKYPVHHRGLGGVSWVYCKAAGDIRRAAKVLSGLAGVEAVLPRAEACRRFHLMSSRIGDLAVIGDKDTVFGQLDEQSEKLPPEYRSHGSLHESTVPLVVYNSEASLIPENFRYNRDLARWLFAGYREHTGMCQ